MTETEAMEILLDKKRAECARLKAYIAELEQALRHYASKTNWSSMGTVYQPAGQGWTVAARALRHGEGVRDGTPG